MGLARLEEERTSGKYIFLFRICEKNYIYNYYKKSAEIYMICQTPLEFFFHEQSYSSLHSGRSIAWDHVRSDINDPCGAIADFCGVNAGPCGVVTIPEAIAGRAVADADRCVTR